MRRLADIKSRVSKPLKLPIHWKKWFGDLPADTSFFVAVGGESFAGKSSFCLKLASYLSLNDKVLYLPLEEPIKRSNTIPMKIRAMAIPINLLKNVHYEDGINSIDKLDKVLKKGKFKFCVIDSVSVFTGENLNAQNDLINYIEDNESVSFIVVLHRKKGEKNVKGVSGWEHSPDVIIWLENENNKRVAEFRKNRFLGNTKPKRFDLGTERIKKEI